VSALYEEYAARGWPSIDPRSRDYCYQPCRFGLHVCGEHPDGTNCMSVANFPTKDAATARALFEAAKADLSEPDKDESDFVVDLMVDHDTPEDFRMNRQMLARLSALAEGFN
jgi:hypothetical protein